MLRPAVAELHVADDPLLWRALGFSVIDDVDRVGAVAVRLLGAGAGTGIMGWTLRGWDGAPLDGLATDPATEGPAASGTHPNTATAVDHVVVATPDRARTSAALDAAGLGRGGRAAAHTAGHARAGLPSRGQVIGGRRPAEAASADPAAFWGVTFAVTDLDAAVALLGTALTVRDAVQPGRRIVTVRRRPAAPCRWPSSARERRQAAPPRRSADRRRGVGAVRVCAMSY